LLLDVHGLSREERKGMIEHLKRWLVQEGAGFDIECVEVKGTPPSYDWGGWRNMSNLRYGTWVKLPRQVERLQEWENATVLTAGDVLGLEVGTTFLYDPNYTIPACMYAFPQVEIDDKQGYWDGQEYVRPPGEQEIALCC
jgi:hypothetical protein